jgi:hypothetical protein
MLCSRSAKSATLPEPRLTSDFQISALKRLAEAGGGFATVLRKGDRTSGAILLIGQIRGENPVLFERFPSLDGASGWEPASAQIDDNELEVAAYWQKRASSDPDLWVIELDVASSERLDGLLASNT